MMTPKHDPQAHELLMDLTARIVLALTECGLPEPEKIKAMEAATSTARKFIYAPARPGLRIVR